MPTIRNTHRCKPAKPDMRPRRYVFELDAKDLVYGFCENWNRCAMAYLDATISPNAMHAESVVRQMIAAARLNADTSFRVARPGFLEDPDQTKYIITFTKRPRIGEKLRKTMKLP